MRPDTSVFGRDGGRMIPSGAAGGGGLSTLVTRPPWLRVIEMMSCLTPSSYTSKSSLVRSETKLPSLSRTMTSFVTRSTCTLNVGGFSGCCLSFSGGLLPGAGVCADSPAARATRRTVDQKALFFSAISPIIPLPTVRLSGYIRLRKRGVRTGEWLVFLRRQSRRRHLQSSAAAAPAPPASTSRRCCGHIGVRRPCQVVEHRNLLHSRG